MSIASNSTTSRALRPSKRIVGVVSEGQNYLAVFLLGVPAAILGNDLFSGMPILKGQSWAVLAPFIFSALSVILWFRYTSKVRYSKSVLAFLVIFAIIWLAIFILESSDNQPTNYTTFLVPVFVGMLILKPISNQGVMRAGWTLAWSTLLIVVISELNTLITSGAATGLMIRIPGFEYALVEGGRWEGPFGSPNYAGPAAAFVVIFAAFQKSKARCLLIIAGILLVILSGSRSALTGLIAGLLVLFIFSESKVLLRFSRRLRALISGSVILLFALAGLVLDPTLNGRIPIWQEYLTFGQAWPWFGVGTASINEKIGQGILYPSFIHAHNMFIDVQGRYGVVLLALFFLLMVIAFSATIRNLQTKSSMGLAIVVAFVIIGLIEVHGSWLYLSLPTCWLIVGVLSSQGISLSTSRIRLNTN